MIAAEENQLLTQTDPGSPCGAMMRRYWQPVALSEELPAGAAPLKVKILGEELALFRDDQGRPGLIGMHCSHRGTDLSYGRVEDGGLRCLYHGWLYDICGRVLDQPGEPGGGANKSAIRHLAYSCQEVGGVIFTYMGPGEPPLLPNYEFLTVAPQYRTVVKAFYECNYLQGNEGNIDPVHLSFLHQYLSEAEVARLRVVESINATDNTLLAKDVAPTIEVEVTHFGLRIYTTRDASADKRYLRVTNFIMPNLSAFGGSTVGDGYAVHWHVPIDDRHHWKYIFAFSRTSPLDDFLRTRSRVELSADYRLGKTGGNRYQQDRASMKTHTFTGMGTNFQVHDAFATESQGAVQNRTEENLVSSDKAIVAARKLILNAIKDVQQGREPQHVIRDAKANAFPNLVVISDVIAKSMDWKEYTRSRELK
ncbi:MAG TPA: Rieske 2Fe-2S domain-containing protein [Candidatus Limnocylindria bacterium]|nr:Rieske 2Fe-2S domain-containing protein [Candidatus Limnocylindria bacterium]